MSRDHSSHEMCDECNALRREPYNVSAHDALVDGDSLRRPQGIAQMFTCSGCGTRWERFRHKALGNRSAAVWRTL